MEAFVDGLCYRHLSSSSNIVSCGYRPRVDSFPYRLHLASFTQMTSYRPNYPREENQTPIRTPTAFSVFLDGQLTD